MDNQHRMAWWAALALAGIVVYLLIDGALRVLGWQDRHLCGSLLMHTLA